MRHSSPHSPSKSALESAAREPRELEEDDAEAIETSIGSGINLSPGGASTTRPLDGSQEADLSNDQAKDLPHNFLVMAAFLVIQRLGWIFKTESIIMPAVADMVGAGGWLRGCLPVLSRFGLSVPPLFYSRRVKTAPRKKTLLFKTSACMSITFLGLAYMWSVRAAIGPAWMAVAFLCLYMLFFMAVGVNQIVLGTLTGKLILANHRGRLLLVANMVGATVAITAAMTLMPMWLAEAGSFAYIFGFAGLMFGINALMSQWLREPEVHQAAPRQTARELVKSAWRILREDRMFRRVACIAGLFGASFALFPHYQAIAIGEMGLERTDMMQWVVVQNIGTAVFSMFVGPMADRRGNRAVLRGVMLCVLIAPVMAISLPHMDRGAAYFPLVFLLVGMTPVTVRILHNYVLELAPITDHPLYLSTLSLVVGVPVMLSPVLGIVIDAVGFDGVFLSIAALVFLAWCLTWRLSEPRHREST